MSPVTVVVRPTGHSWDIADTSIDPQVWMPRPDPGVENRNTNARSCAVTPCLRSKDLLQIPQNHVGGSLCQHSLHTSCTKRGFDVLYTYLFYAALLRQHASDNALD
jgi:hypothetical protein